MHSARFASRTLAFALFVASAVVLGVVPASAQQGEVDCGGFYRVQTGDTLRAITVRTYPHDRYDVVFQANRDVLANPAQIEVGQLLFLPCEETGPTSRAEALLVSQRTPTAEDQRGTRFAEQTVTPQSVSPATRLAQTESLPKPSNRGRSATEPEVADQQGTQQVAVVSPQGTTFSQPKRGARAEPMLMLSAAGLEPLAGPGLDGGGLVGTLIQAALRKAGSGFNLKPAFVNDRAAHLDVLLPLETFGLSYPWPAPDCARPSGKHASGFCDAFEAFVPIFQVEMRIVAHADNPDLKSLTDQPSTSHSICRPVDFPPFDLEIQNVAAIVEGASLAACLDMLGSGEVDLVSAPAMMMQAGELPDDFVEIEALRTQQPVHAVFPRGSVVAERLRRDLDNGMQQLQRSGEWFRIVSDYLRQFNATLPGARG